MQERRVNYCNMAFEDLDINMRKIRDFVNTCLYRYGTDFLQPTMSEAISQEEAGGSVSKAKNGKPTALLCGTSTTPQFAQLDREVKVECADHAEEELEETDPDILEKTIPVKGDRLLSLFRFCPKCNPSESRYRTARTHLFHVIPHHFRDCFNLLGT
ncbi:hypothetical protein Y032_0055g2564 [Ancylostoma ceylanicum]|uniref:Uncharacterized protein n=1 Tax=Ancylostoma ceylanicum TaxID=53326 RepID=A0A016U572_9BILA|nr:hypothetical protein Y032_0055g2564 [Ancylostoma ceylanicum]